MSTIDASGNIHRGAGAPGGGQFAGKVNSAPERTLDPSTWPREGAPNDVTGLREVLAEQLRTDADLRRAIEVMEQQGIDFRVYSPNAEQIAEMVKAGIMHERWRDVKKPGALDEYSLEDVSVLGGDEIRLMSPRQRQHMLSKALRAADRLQGYAHELEDKRPKETENLRIIDLTNVTEDDTAAVWRAARDQIGARGVIRTYEDFYNHAHDTIDPVALLGPAHNVITDAEVKAAWSHYQRELADDYEEEVGGVREVGTFVGYVERALKETDGR